MMNCNVDTNIDKQAFLPLEGHDWFLEAKLVGIYRKLRENEYCKKCREKFGDKIENCGHPLSFYVIGEKFRNEKYRVVFVGKKARTGWEENPIDKISGFIDARCDTKEDLFLPPWSTYPFWQCIKEICWRLWNVRDPDIMWRKIMITNIVKCVVENKNEVLTEVSEYCILKTRFLEWEIRIVKPTHVIFFTGPDFDEFIDELDFGYEEKEDLEKKEREWIMDNKKYKILWWHRAFKRYGRVMMHFLRVNHPSNFYWAKNEIKDKFAKKIADWIRKNGVET